MAGSFIGASLDDLQRTSTDMSGFASTARNSGTTVVTTTRRAVGNIESETNTAEATIIDALETMKTGMATANATLQGANYVGNNANVARNAAADMDRKVAQATADVTDAFNQFRTRINGLNGELEAIAAEFDGYAAAAGDTGDSFSVAMNNQATNLDDVMNTGLSIG